MKINDTTTTLSRKWCRIRPVSEMQRRGMKRITTSMLLLAAAWYPCWSFQNHATVPSFPVSLSHRQTKMTLTRRFETASSSAAAVGDDDHAEPTIGATTTTTTTAISSTTVDKTDDTTTTRTTTTTDEPKKSFWKPKGSKTRWQERVHVNDLQIGQELYGHVITDLLGGKTGPKLFFDCGVGRTDPKGNWYMVNGMLRLPREKASVSRKRAAKLRSRDSVKLYVSRIQLGCGRLEVCLTPEEVDQQQKKTPPKTPVTSLKPNQTVEGTILKVYPYGATVDVGANRRGLLHITKVAALYDKYIDKEKGLIEAGIENGARVRLMVESVEKRRLFLDFTPDVKEEASKALQKEKQQDEEVTLDSAELDDWAAYANQQATGVQVQQGREITTAVEDDSGDDYDNDEDDEEYDDYDEESDIEEALGLDTY
ncbi:RNA-binding S1 domain containing protein [Nitzschia inconspicua]|uniref:RNA-binding S1 domain containing protein n=1 Tax=Nitzschia inconspicua TaxID=303405 RepID=A0A9K3LYT7_9STRA|nr:RNA-binding S1 domain containing protein [Nitzschia inconspicua]